MSHPTDDSEQVRILAALLAMPDTDALDAVREMYEQAPWLDSVLPELEDTGLEHWQAEHTRLFVSGYPKTACPPYESAYRQGTMGGVFANDLAGLYRRAGLVASEAPTDYLGTMLECVAYLQDLGLDELLSELVEEHINHWVPRFARDLREQATLGLYRELGTRIGLRFPPPEREDERHD